jgi:4-hydroxy-tetrahydrodipicolinate reductase
MASPNSTPLTLAIAGPSGRMGQALLRALPQFPQVSLTCVLSRQDAPGAPRVETPEQAFAAADAVIDFTRPALSLAIAEAAAEQKKIHVCGTTGFTPEEMRRFRSVSAGARVVWSANMSLGVALLASLVAQAAKALPEADLEILEMHHRLKEDAPSGTALLLGEAAAGARGKALADLRDAPRDGLTGPRKTGTIGFAALRGGDVIGDHTAMFAMAGERIELSHKASNRDIYATGALRAALWAAGQKAGFYGMADMVG